MDKNGCIKIAFITFLVGCWQILAYSGMYPEAIIPKVETILLRWWYLIREDHLLMRVAVSLSTIIVAVAIALALSVLLILIGKKSYIVKECLKLSASIAGPIPGIALLPLIILLLGLSTEAMMVILIHAMIWPLWTTLDLSVTRIHKRFNRFIHAFKLSRWKRLKDVYFKGILPDLLTGIEVAWGRGWRALLSIEMIFGIVGNRSGLGWLIYERRMYMDTAGMLAGLLTIALCGIVFESVLFKSKLVEVHRENHY